MAKSDVQDDVDAMFDQKQATDEDPFAGMDDLLDQVTEDDAEAWIPKEAGEGIVGIVTKRDQTRSDFAADGEDPFVPTVVLETKAGDKYRVIAYSSMLKREIVDKDPQVGDTMAVKYFGERPLKTGKFAGRPFKYYGVIVRKN